MEPILQWITSNYDLTAIGALLTFLTILFTFYNKVAKPMYNKTIKPVVRFFKSVAESPERITALDGKIDLILEELKPNSGSSIKDIVNRLDERLSLSEEQRLLLLNTNPHGIWVSDKYGSCTWVNQTLIKKVNAKDLDSLRGENWINCVFVSDRKKVMDEWERSSREQKGLRSTL